MGLIAWIKELFFVQPIQPRQDAKTFDTRGGTWGDKVEWFHVGTRRVTGWKDERPIVGDILKSPMASGRVGIFVFTDVELMRDPPDMFFGTVEFHSYEEG